MMPIKFNPLPDVVRLRELLSYDPVTGIFRWINSRGSRGAGTIAGNLNTTGARQIQIDGNVYVAHRLAWLYVTEEEPPEEIDHKDANPDNNIWDNLREATHSQNCCNRVRKNSSGYKSVWWHTIAKKWHAQVKLGGKVLWRQHFDTAKAAHEAYVIKAREFHGDFMRAA